MMVSSYMTEEVWLPVASRIQYKILLLISRIQQGQAPKYLPELMHRRTYIR